MTRSALLALLAIAALAPVHAADLTIRIDNVGSSEGQLMVAVYDGAATFLRQPLRSAAAAASAGSTTVVVRDLAPGDYGIAVYHDANGNGKMDTNMMGIPVEPIAFGRDAQGTMGPPSFDAVKLAVPAAGLATSVTLR